MLVVIEGPEKVGKTTFLYQLADWWRENRKSEIWRCHRGRWANNPEDVTKSMMRVRENRDKLIIFDRFYPSDLVYRTWDGEKSEYPVNAEYMESVFGPQIDREGVRLLLTEDPKVLRTRRTQDDIPIPPELEARLYELVCPFNWIRLTAEFRRNKDLWVPRWESWVKKWEASQE